MRVNPILISRPQSESVYQKDRLDEMAKTFLPPASERSLANNKVSALAKDWSSGSIHYKEATSRFIDAVTGPLKESLSEKDYQNMVDQITDLLISDQQFIEDLTKNLSKLS